MSIVDNSQGTPSPANSPQDLAPAPRPFGFWATLGWTVLSIACGGLASLFCLVLLYPDHIVEAITLLSNARTFALLTIAASVVQIVVLALVVRHARWPVAEYLGLIMPSRRTAVIAAADFAAFVFCSDLLTYLLNRDIVTPFQVDMYRSAQESGSLLLLWVTLTLVGPASEEVMFRGFLFRGWTQSQRAVLPAIFATSALWSILHIQYDWYGILQIFAAGLLLGWIRWRSGSTTLTFFLHGAMNAWATIETIIRLHWSP